jgi:hypothetical protein
LASDSIDVSSPGGRPVSTASRFIAWVNVDSASESRARLLIARVGLLDFDVASPASIAIA